MCFIELRKKIGTQAEVASLLNVNQQTVAVWEKGKAYPRRQMLKKLSKLFGVSEMDILISIDNSNALYKEKIC